MTRASRLLAPSLGTILLVSACVQTAADPQAPVPGAVVDALPQDGSALYSPVDRGALAFGLPDLVQGKRLVPSPPDVIRSDEEDFAHDLAVRPILIEHAIGPSAVTIEHKGDRFDDVPSVALSAVQIRDVSAELLEGFDPSFYLLLTSVTKEQWDWVGDKPGPQRVTIEGRDVWSTKWIGFQMAWYTWGDVLYIVMAQNEQLLTTALRQMPWPSATT